MNAFLKYTFPQTNRHLLNVFVCSSSQMYSIDGQTIYSVLGGCLKKRGGGCVCVAPPVFQLSKITQAEFALQKPLPRQLESEQL